jgi:hypothetical protein
MHDELGEDFWWGYDEGVPQSPFLDEEKMGWGPVDNILNSPTPPSPTLLERYPLLAADPSPLLDSQWLC